MARKNIFWFCFIGFTLLACAVSDPELEPIKIGVDEELIVDMVQIIHQDKLELGLSFVSSQPYDCGGAGYEYDIFKTTDNIGIYLTSVLLPQPCAAGPTPAREEIPIAHQPGQYAILIAIGDLILNNGMLAIDELGFRLNMQQEYGISISHDYMFRIPSQTIWGYVYNANAQAEVFQQVTHFLGPITESIALPVGYYGHFNIIGQHSIQLLQPGLKAGTQSFILQYHDQISTLDNAVDELRTQMPAGTELKVYTWNGSIL